MNHIVYKTTNVVNNKIYIGVHSTEDIEDGYLGSGKLLHKAIVKYGKSNFTREIIKLCDSRDEALELERLLVDKEFLKREDVYNLVIGGPRGNHNYSTSEETKKKISEANKGKPVSEETKRKISETLTGRPSPQKGTKHSDESKAKMSLASKGRTLSAEWRAKIGAGLKNAPKRKYKIVKCPYCGKEGASTGMTRYHFDNCKSLL